MSSVPAKTLSPGSAGYQAVYDKWVADGKAGWVESLRDGWLYRAIRPNPADSQPTFTLVSSGFETREIDEFDDDDFPRKGYMHGMSVAQSTLPGGRRRLPQEPV